MLIVCLSCLISFLLASAMFTWLCTATGAHQAEAVCSLVLAQSLDELPITHWLMKLTFHRPNFLNLL